ncbi:MAG: aspartate kinase [Lentimicrobiaceae bacterium]|nr:aspartate kinase [Lentimicrobiaceae bacterium]
MIKVLKFGGASVKNSKAIANIPTILRMYNDCKVVVIVSAIGKTTNALEHILHCWQSSDTSNLNKSISALKKTHMDIAYDLFKNDNEVVHRINSYFDELTNITAKNYEGDFSANYSKIVAFGEYLSTYIVSKYLNKAGFNNELFDAKNLIITNEGYVDANVDWDTSQKNILKTFDNINNIDTNIFITQGFIAGNTHNEQTTLGREGSDYSAAIIANILDASDITVWKDVAGIMTADPNLIPTARLIKHLSYKEAIELSYYGASIIHPKTIKPLQNKNIPLYVKCFFSPKEDGTLINDETIYDNNQSSIIIKPKQVLFSINASDFSFIVEDNLRYIFQVFAELKIKVNLLQMSALTCSVCFDEEPEKIKKLIKLLSSDYNVKYNTKLSLITIRYFTEEIISSLLKDKNVLLEQRSRVTAQFVID